MISTVIVTYNEEKALKDCLSSVVKESDEIVVIDLGSTDNTLSIAKKFQAKIFSHQLVDYVEKVRNFAISKAAGDWILVLDPDERVSVTLWNKLKSVVSEGKFELVNIPRKNIFFGKWVAHTNWWPDKHIRFFKKGKVSWGEKIHHYPLVEGKILNLDSRADLAIVHYGYSSIDQFILRQTRYSTIEAKNLFDVGESFSWINFFWRPIREFLVRYIKHLGFLDGFYGLILTYLMMVYKLQVMIALWELERKK